MSSDSKKFPINLNNCRSRKNSFDSRPRTDSNSSSNTYLLKNLEFAFGELLTPQKRVNTVSIHDVKNCDLHFSSDMIIEEPTHEEEDFIQLARSIAEQNEGFCLSETCESLNIPLEFKCKMNHVWKSSEVLNNGTWCVKCKHLLDRAKHFAECFEGSCVSKVYQILLEFKCKNGHVWKADSSRYMNQQWCKQCLTQERSKRKESLMIEIQDEESELLRIQQGLFQQAKQKMQQELKAPENDEDGAETLAEEMAKDYMKAVQSSDAKLTEQVSSVYKVICSSESSIRNKYFRSKTKDQITSCFRQFARNLHPDKNKHPYAGEAFLKISSIYAASMAEV